MSYEIHYKTFEDHYYESERLNIEARKELSRIKKELEKLQAENSELKKKLDLAVEAISFVVNHSGTSTDYNKKCTQALKEIKEI